MFLKNLGKSPNFDSKTKMQKRDEMPEFFLEKRQKSPKMQIN